MQKISNNYHTHTLDVFVYDSQSRGCIIMMDLSDRKTVASVQRWKDDLDSKVKDLLSFPPFRWNSRMEDRYRLSFSQTSLTWKGERLGRSRYFWILFSSLFISDKVAALHKLHGFLGWAEVSAKDDHMLRETVTFLVDAMVSHRRWHIG